MRRHAGRVNAVHVKDFAPAGTNLDEDGWADVGAGTLAQIYRDAAQLIRAQCDRIQPPAECALLPRVVGGLRGLQFVAACVKSNAGGSRMAPIEAR
jgi:hypothetical protein